MVSSTRRRRMPTAGSASPRGGCGPSIGISTAAAGSGIDSEGRRQKAVGSYTQADVVSCLLPTADCFLPTGSSPRQADVEAEDLFAVARGVMERHGKVERDRGG